MVVLIYLLDATAASSVHIFPVADPDDPYGQFIILDGIHDAIRSLTHAISLLARQFLAALWTGIFGELRDAFEDPGQILLG